MKKFNKKISDLIKEINHFDDGSIEGGFYIIDAQKTAMVIGGDGTNNCNGTNCAVTCHPHNSNCGPSVF